jgi:hypothetical protein
MIAEVMMANMSWNIEKVKREIVGASENGRVYGPILFIGA